MGTVSLRIDDDLLEEASKKAKALHISRAEYFRQAVIEKNKKVAGDLLRQRIQQASRKVRQESMRVNRELAASEGVPDA